MMRRYTLPLLLIGTLCSAQVTPITWHLSFDPGADRTLDSLQGCWQVGAPDKTVFDSAYSAPNALVTDTVLPYPVGGISYAEFSAPVNWFGEEIQLAFSHRLEIDPGEAYGWIEWYDAGITQSWIKADPWQNWSMGYVEWTGDGLDTDSALIFTGTNNGWGMVELSWRCIGVLQGPQQRASYPDSMRFRFAFQGSANTNGRDGWMIDDLVVTNNGCTGGLAEADRNALAVFPNPASTEVVLERSGTEPLELDLFRADGALVRRERMVGARHMLDLAAQPAGLYLLVVDDGRAQASHRLMVQR